MTFAALQTLLQSRPIEERRKVFEQLRTEFPIHELESEFNAPAEVILEAIARSPDITKRGIRGLLAEAAFIRDIIPTVASDGWVDRTPPIVTSKNALTFDAILEREGVNVRIQVKTQRRGKGNPWIRKFPQPWGESYVVETQRTRGGKDKKTGRRTRPYRYGQFDVVAVCMWASTGDWTSFRYAIGNDLFPEKGSSEFIAHIQPIPIQKDGRSFWTASLRDVLNAFVIRRNEPPRPSKKKTFFR